MNCSFSLLHFIISIYYIIQEDNATITVKIHAFISPPLEEFKSKKIAQLSITINYDVKSLPLSQEYISKLINNNITTLEISNLKDEKKQIFCIDRVVLNGA
ncbi:hypothetical protein HAX54_043200 [Datura stramonium]|uniref:Uncharacterized protein n=1 Tax=Datura stramonium TaxID=4076 RepID=A0ABS8W481_DATST|nr:hypothetical protein [Datura stramonium]